MWISRAILMLLAAVLVIAPVCVASNTPLTKVKIFSTDLASRLKRTMLRHSVVKTVTAGMAALLLLTTSAHGEGGAGQDNVSSFCSRGRYREQEEARRYPLGSTLAAGATTWQKALVLIRLILKVWSMSVWGITTAHPRPLQQ